MNELTLKADIENLDSALDFITSELEAIHCSNKTITKIAIAVEEMFVNISSYAYPSKDPGYVRMVCDVLENPKRISISFIDNGIPYNPLDKKDPDTEVSAEDRDIGGLGIYLVKKTMDEVTYIYENGNNILTLKKNIEKNQ